MNQQTALPWVALVGGLLPLYSLHTEHAWFCCPSRNQPPSTSPHRTTNGIHKASLLAYRRIMKPSRGARQDEATVFIDSKVAVASSASRMGIFRLRLHQDLDTSGRRCWSIHSRHVDQRDQAEATARLLQRSPVQE